ncbi:MAG TPA: DUF58 domain-containing protein [Candidatus Limnocylindrales bacterium]|nr:DUF58 domain-containing protein [Candidatus Limnocylindrales bacterium]
MIRRLQFLVVAVVLLIAAFSTGLSFLFYAVYLGLLAIGGSYVLTRFGLADLEAGYRVDHRQAHVGDDLRTTYSISNASNLPKPWLEVYNPTDLPVPLPGRALGLRSWAQRSWVAIVPLTRRGTFRVEPMIVRTGDPFGFFEAAATVGRPTMVTVFPQVVPLPRWRLPNANLEGSHSAPERTLQTTPLATTVRPYAPGDSFNRIHWRSTARLGEIQVKEFDLEQTADVWLYVDLETPVQAGEGDVSTVEESLRVAASIAHDAFLENRAVGLTTSGHRLVSIPADRGPRQRQKVMQLLAAVEGDGMTPLAEVLLTGLPKLRRGMTAVVITPSRERVWIRTLTTLRGRGVTAAVVLLDAPSYESAGRRHPKSGDREDDLAMREQRALRFALAEYELKSYEVRAGDNLGAVLA